MRTVNTAPSFATRNALPIYFALTFAVSWGAVLMAVGFDGLGNPEALNRPLVYVAMLLGPSVAGLLAIGLVSGRPGFRELWSRLTRWRVRAHWYAIALLAAPLLAGALLFALALVSAEFLPPTFTAQGIAGAFALGLLPGLLVGLFEELGWTGFAVPAMRRRHGAVFTGVVVGLLWGAWHIVLFWERSSFADPLALGLLVARLFAWVPAYRLLMVWVARPHAEPSRGDRHAHEPRRGPVQPRAAVGGGCEPDLRLGLGGRPVGRRGGGPGRGRTPSGEVERRSCLSEAAPRRPCAPDVRRTWASNRARWIVVHRDLPELASEVGGLIEQQRADDGTVP